MTNAFPNFANNDVTGSEFDLPEQDVFFRWQMGQENPKIISSAGLRLVGVAAEEKGAKKTLSKLHAIGILTDEPPAVHTALIKSGFTNELAHLAATKQKKLINLLFTWEEELMRWRLIEEEEAEIEQVMQAAADSGSEESKQEMRNQFAVRLEELKGQWRLMPSLRSKEARDETQLPGYAATSNNEPRRA